MKIRHLFAALLAAAMLSQIPAQAEEAPAHTQDHTHMHDDAHHSSADAVEEPLAFDPAIMFGTLELSGAFTQAMLPDAVTAGGFLTITNHGEEADRLMAVSSPNAANMQLHGMKMDGETMVMWEQQEGMALLPGSTIILSPRGQHLMFLQVGTPFSEGEEVPVTLTFERAGTVDIMLKVGSPSATGQGY